VARPAQTRVVLTHAILTPPFISPAPWEYHLSAVRNEAKENRMRRIMLAVLIPLSLAGCLSLHENPPRQNSTIVVPPGSTVTCANGQAPPC